MSIEYCDDGNFIEVPDRTIETRDVLTPWDGSEVVISALQDAPALESIPTSPYETRARLDHALEVSQFRAGGRMTIRLCE